jgi:hypothetical protein
MPARGKASLAAGEIDLYVGLSREYLERSWREFWTAGLSPSCRARWT